MKSIALLLLVFSLSCAGQSSAFDISHQELFQNADEKTLFEEIKNGKDIDYLFLFLVSDDPARIRYAPSKAKERIQEFMNLPEISKLKNSVNTKSLKRLYKAVHDRFLTRYDDNPLFSDIFETGVYNCATASALYALLLEELSIPYAIRETPTHVYLVVSPGQDEVVFETTAPGATTLVVNDKMKEQYLEFLYNNKIISKEDWAGSNKESLFQQYFYSDKTVDRRQLAGILYYNRGVDYLERENYKDANASFEKAYFLYPNNRLQYFISASIAMYLMNPVAGSQETLGDYYIRFMQLNKGEMSTKMLLEYIDDSANKFLFKNPDPAKFHRIYSTVMSALDDTAVIKELKRIYYFHTAHYFDIKNQYDSAAACLEVVYNLNKNDLLVQELITGAASNYLQSLAMTEHAIDTVASYFRKYPFLESNKRLQEFYVFCLSREIAEYYKKDKVKEAAAYVQLMKNLLQKDADLAKRTDRFLTGAVLEMYYYFVRIKKYKDAKTFLQEMDKYLPGNEEIVRRLKRIDEIIANQ